MFHIYLIEQGCDFEELLDGQSRLLPLPYESLKALHVGLARAPVLPHPHQGAPLGRGAHQHLPSSAFVVVGVVEVQHLQEHGRGGRGRGEV